MKATIFLFFLIFSFYLNAQDFRELPGVDAIYFEDIYSIEYRVGSIENKEENLDDIRDNEAEIDRLNKQLALGGDPRVTADINKQLKTLYSKRNTLDNRADARDPWTSFFTKSLSQTPVYTLHSSEKILFAFDDLNKESTDYSYTVIPYNWDWTEVLNLSENEYLENYSTSRITTSIFSEITTVDYTKYRFTFPNEEIQPTTSGNFLLVVYETNSDQVAFTRRIQITEQTFFFEEDIRNVDFDRDSLQYINFTISYPKELNHLAPARDVKVVVLQNGRYDNMVIKEKPALSIGNKLRYGYQEKIGFQPGKEFRNIQIQTLEYPLNGIAKVHKGTEENEVYLLPQKARVFHPNFFYRDFNGLFVTMNGVDNKQIGDPDYAHVMYIFDRHEPFENADLYIVGKFSDWQFKEEYRLSFNARDRRYEGETFLKQGYYDYYFALKHKDSDLIDIDETEGHAFETSNDYSIFVYYITPTGKYDRLVAVRTFTVGN